MNKTLGYPLSKSRRSDAPESTREKVRSPRIPAMLLPVAVSVLLLLSPVTAQSNHTADSSSQALQETVGHQGTESHTLPESTTSAGTIAPQTQAKDSSASEAEKGKPDDPSLDPASTSEPSETSQTTADHAGQPNDSSSSSTKIDNSADDHHPAAPSSSGDHGLSGGPVTTSTHPVVPDFIGANAIRSGKTALGSVHVSAPAGTGGLAVVLTSGNPAVLGLPAQVIVPPGARSASFSLQASAVQSETTVPVTAFLNGTSIQGSIRVRPAESDSAPPTRALRFIPLVPCRMVDTRDTSKPILTTGETRAFPMTGSPCGVPSDAAAYSLNVTVVPAGPLRYLTLWPKGQTQPTASTLNSEDGRIKANAAIVPAGAEGAVNVYVTDATHVILDINGYFVPADNPSALAFYPLTPCRVLDTRNAQDALGGFFLNGGEERILAIPSSPCHIPSNAQAYSLNFTVVPHSPLSYLSIWPSGQPMPVVSTLNAPTGSVTANAAVIPAGQGGDVSVFATHDTELIIDINGYFAPPSPGGLSLYLVTPCRVFDSRLQPTRSHKGGETEEVDSVENKPETTVEIEGEAEIHVSDACGIPPTAQAVVMNATVVPGDTMPFLSLWPDTESQPTVSTLNANDGKIASNMAVVPTESGGIKAFTAGHSHVILDVATYFAP